MKDNNSMNMGFLDHLEELRWRIIKSLMAMVFGSIISFNFIDNILTFLLSPTRSTSNPINLQVLSVQGMFLIKWFISFVSGLILALPIILFQLWKFITPGLKINEKRYAFPVVFFAFFAFIIGVSFGYFIIIPFSLEFFTGISSSHVENNFSIQYYFSYLIWILMGSGLIFQLPVVSLLLSLIGFLTPAFMRHYRRHSIIIVLILSSIITPPDPVSMLIMAFPLIFLYEMSIVIVWIVNGRSS